MTLRGLNSEQYILGRELGRGGEGTVYELQNDGSRVLKQYNEPLSPTQIHKLQRMVAMRNPAVEAYAAWPTALATDSSGVVCGFAMKKLAGFVPLHMIFSPLDRKKMFPDKGYNFLVHVARNLATAFYKLHEAGLVVGDVNEGNILINGNGLVSFIDCDSFQIKDDNGYFFCEVGVPRYTPPELLSAKTFEQTVRSMNTDSFSMAILIFQLLFMGRHPFAGRNKSAMDIDEETAIKMHEFAYSLTNKKKRLLPPNDSFDINNLTEGLIANFHQAFETELRPQPADWVKALDTFLLEIITCDESRVHSYPAKMKECPWCYFKRTRGIMYFLDDSYMKANGVLSDIEHFVNGFKIEKLELKKWTGSLTDPLVSANPIAGYWQRARVVQWAIMLIIIMATIFTAIEMKITFTLLGIGMLFFTRKVSNVTKDVKNENKRLEDIYEQHAVQLRKQVSEYNNPHDLGQYVKGLDVLSQLVTDFRKLPEAADKLRKLMEERIFNDYLDGYLKQFDIQSHNITSIGPAKKTLLLNAGIRNACDIQELNTRKVAGIGPKNTQVLLDWRHQMESGFVYMPDADKLAAGMRQVDSDVEALKRDLEQGIRKEYQSANYMRQNITNRLLVLETQIKATISQTTQTHVDMLAFSRFSRFI